MTSPSRGYAAAVAALLLLAVAAVFLSPLSTDTGWLLVEARRVLQGERLYVDIKETNPPLIVWLWIGPAALGAWLQWSDRMIAAATVAGTIVLCSVLSLRLLARHDAASRSLRLWLLGAWLAAVAGLFPWDVAEREQLAALFTLPYACLAAVAIREGRARSPAAFDERGVAALARLPSRASVARLGATRLFNHRVLVLLAGLLAGIGFAFKPFFLGALVAIEVVVIGAVGWRRGLSRGELWAAVGFQAVYGLAVLVLTPEYLRDTVPVVVATYGAYGNGIRWVLRTTSAWLPATVATVTLAASWLGPRTMAAVVTRVMSAATLGWLLGFVAQGKGWRYHLIAVSVFGAVALAAALVHLSSTGPALWRRSAGGRLQIGVVVAALLLAAGPAAVAIRSVALVEWGMWRGGDPVAGLTEVIGERAAGEPVYFLSTSMAPAFPVVNQAGAQWPYHYHFLWPLPGLYRGRTGTPIAYRAPAAQGPLERAFFDTVVSDLERIPPRLLVVDRQRDQQGMAYGRPFDFLGYFSASPRFVAVLSRYRRAGAIGPFEVYERVR